MLVLSTTQRQRRTKDPSSGLSDGSGRAGITTSTDPKLLSVQINQLDVQVQQEACIEVSLVWKVIY
jgi:hypothetical protein